MEDYSKILNVHHFGSVDNLPKNTVYVGRPGPYGNPYSSQSGSYTREETVALHRIDLYKKLKYNFLYKQELIKELKNKNLACWCSHPSKIIACHALNYLHILNDVRLNRNYSDSILFYLMDDLKYVFNKLEEEILKNSSQKEYLNLYLSLGDTKIDIRYLLSCIKTQDSDNDDNFLFLLSTIVIELELSLYEKNSKLKEYYFSHIRWRIHRYLKGKNLAYKEPQKPTFKINSVKNE